MADIDPVEDTASLNDSLNETATNGTGREVATVQGLVVAYTLMFTMALVPIFIGSLRSVQYHYNLRVRNALSLNLLSSVPLLMQKKGERPEERIRMRDAAMFPFFASGALFGLYIVFKVCIVHDLFVTLSDRLSLSCYCSTFPRSMSTCS